MYSERCELPDLVRLYGPEGMGGVTSHWPVQQQQLEQRSPSSFSLADAAVIVAGYARKMSSPHSIASQYCQAWRTTFWLCLRVTACLPRVACSFSVPTYSTCRQASCAIPWKNK